MSKTKKIRVTKKNRKDKGIRLSFIVENPHSKGLNFSRSKIDFLLSKIIKTIISKEIKDISKKFKNNIIIFYW